MKKLLGEERRKILLDMLKQEGQPITGTELANRANVSRQVIVSDMALLKARNVPIMATSQGYVLFTANIESAHCERQIACRHISIDTEEELNILVDAGVTVKNVTVEHAVYGEITASIMVSSRHDVQQFMQKIADTKSNLLLELTEGIHIHLISASSEEKLDFAVQQLQHKGFLIAPN
ncbi:transcription repressor NadR [Viridibacillus sp. YIM B01967]|uniref:Transcription repressor NadR n=1 Tax=Viridibacillus soli TaxID=2798301 RepID=A0ABS1H206_9BACL|nr:transcription repressor NadR [Viridibacillus soli]MBK3493421.1 transcription repressor NadR [Viridibacillus soli]